MTSLKKCGVLQQHHHHQYPQIYHPPPPNVYCLKYDEAHRRFSYFYTDDMRAGIYSEGVLKYLDRNKDINNIYYDSIK